MGGGGGPAPARRHGRRVASSSWAAPSASETGAPWRRSTSSEEAEPSRPRSQRTSQPWSEVLEGGKANGGNMDREEGAGGTEAEEDDEGTIRTTTTTRRTRTTIPTRATTRTSTTDDRSDGGCAVGNVSVIGRLYVTLRLWKLRVGSSLGGSRMRRLVQLRVGLECEQFERLSEWQRGREPGLPRRAGRGRRTRRTR